MGRGMETKIEAPEQESGVMMLKIAPVLDREAKDLGIDDSSQSSAWRKKIGALMMVGTIFAGGLLAGSAKEAKAGGRFVQEMIGVGVNAFQQSLNAGIQGGQDAVRQGQQLEADRIRTKLQLEADAIRKMQNMQSDQVRLMQDQLRQIGQEELNALRDFKDGKISKERLMDLKQEYKEQKENLTRGR